MIITIREDLTSNVTTDDGLRECELPNYNPETLVPFGNSTEVEEFANAIGSNPNYFVPKLSDEEKQAAKDAAAITQNSSRAKQELLATDWCENSSVRDSSVFPHLANVEEFDNFRLAMRSIIVNKVTNVETWLTVPNAVWVTE